MRGKSVVAMLLLLLISYSGVSQQSLNDYSFIEVPEVFDFLRGKDQYQLNSLTKFLFNKYGFNAYFGRELPNVRKCDGLYAEIEHKSSFVYTRISVVVKDCNGVELYRSLEGKSKLKEYKKAYHQALRRAFDNFENLGVAQPDIQLVDENTSKPTSIDAKPIASDKVIESNFKDLKGTINLPTAKFSNYNFNGTSYLLRKTNMGYSLFQEVLGAEDDLLLLGRLKVAKDVITYTNIMGETNEASFDTDKNLTIKLPSGSKTYILERN